MTRSPSVSLAFLVGNTPTNKINYVCPQTIIKLSTIRCLYVGGGSKFGTQRNFGMYII